MGGASYTFDGSGDVVNFGDLTDFDGITNFTITFWVNIDASPATGGMVGKYQGGSDNMYIYFDSSDRFTTNVGNAGARLNSKHTVDINTVLTAGTWAHIAWVWEGGNTQSYYFDGVSKTVTDVTATNPTAFPAIGSDFVIGALGPSQYYGNQDMAYVKLHNKVMTQAEVIDSMYNPDINCDSLMFYAPMISDTVTDLVNGHTATNLGDASPQSSGPPIYLTGGM